MPVSGQEFIDALGEPPKIAVIDGRVNAGVATHTAIKNPHNATLGDLNNVDLSTINLNDVLSFNGTHWVGVAPSGGGSIQSDWDETNNIEMAFIQNKPDLAVVSGGQF